MQNKFDKNFIKKVQDHIESLVVDRLDTLAIHAHNRLTTETRVDTGQARAGWNFSLNKIDIKVPKRPNKGIVLTKPESIPNRNARKIGDAYYLTNGVHHVVYLNEGNDKIPATNFIEREVAQAVIDIEEL